MPAPDLTPTVAAVVASVAKAKGVHDSTVAFINGVGAKILAAVTAALEADDAADQGSIDAATAAVATELAALDASSDALAAAVNANP